jgi:hypothetical protein
MEILIKNVDVEEFEKQNEVSYEDCLDEEVYCNFEYGF